MNRLVTLALALSGWVAALVTVIVAAIRLDDEYEAGRVQGHEECEDRNAQEAGA